MRIEMAKTQKRRYIERRLRKETQTREQKRLIVKTEERD
jgi:hypothetical protein